MLIKEYRMCMPFTLEEFRIAQRYLVAKSSKERTLKGQRVEIKENRPFSDEHGTGQYTHKVYHIGNSVPSWTRSIVPASALAIEEKAWNCYPRTHTIMTCPFFGEKLKIEVFTIFCEDRGEQDNIFNLDADTLKKRTVERIDIAYDDVSHMHIEPGCDPVQFKSKKTGRGQFRPDWQQTVSPMMCSYKLCNVEFNYWGFQSKVEQFIHQLALRDTIHKAHREAFCWIDDWYDLTMADIDRIEAETALVLKDLNDRAAGLSPDTSSSSSNTTSHPNPPQTKPLSPGESVTGPITQSNQPQVSVQDASRPSDSKTSIQQQHGASNGIASGSGTNNDDSDDEFYDALEEIVPSDSNSEEVVISKAISQMSMQPRLSETHEDDHDDADGTTDADADGDADGDGDEDDGSFPQGFVSELNGIELPSLPATLPVFPSIRQGKWNRRRTKLFTITQGSPNHRGIDIVHAFGSQATIRIRVRFTYGNFGKRLKKEAVDLYALMPVASGSHASGDGQGVNGSSSSSLTSSRSTVSFSGNQWELVNRAVTAQYAKQGDPGSVNIEISRAACERLKPGFNLMRAVVLGDMSYASVGVYLYPPRTEAVVFSLHLIWDAITSPEHDTRAGMLGIVNAWARKGYAIIYVGCHSDRHKNSMAAWLQQKGLPFGVLRLNHHRTKSDLFLAEYIRSLQDGSLLDIVAAYAQERFEIESFVQVLPDKRNIFTIGDNHGYLGTSPITDLLSHADSHAGRKSPKVATPILPTHGWSLLVGRRL
eukprot:TRINITY_DN7780_c0_g5_i1.p1 TRINITY_DN7780_c0_g5~~TRINITY_DN7780_c0_g5_i1.p1  ORF type:complete len:763 (-),score=148.72 TRINITY_DN7780_c0_g5_i1:184-2472(-)